MSIKSTVETKTIYTLVLDKQEADWLRGIVQNPINSYEGREIPGDFDMRQKFFNAVMPLTTT